MSDQIINKTNCAYRCVTLRKQKFESSQCALKSEETKVGSEFMDCCYKVVTGFDATHVIP